MHTYYGAICVLYNSEVPHAHLEGGLIAKLGFRMKSAAGFASFEGSPWRCCAALLAAKDPPVCGDFIPSILSSALPNSSLCIELPSLSSPCEGPES